MHIYICTNFRGQHPVGTSAVIIHHSPHMAEAMLRAALKSQKIEPTDWKPQWKVIKADGPGVYIGDY